MNPSSPMHDAALASVLRSSWHGFLETYEPLRTDLYRYCRHLKRSPWDAEDLQYGPEAARRTVLYGMLFGGARMARADDCGIEARFVQGVLLAAPRVQAVAHRGEWILLHWYQHQDGEAVRAVTRVELDGDRVARLHNYFFNPDFIAEVCGELGVPWRSNGYRWFLPKG